MSLIKLSNRLFALDLDPQELTVYAYLCSLPASAKTLTGAAVISVKQATIGQNCGIKSMTTVSRIIDRLQEKGLAEPLERSCKANHRKGTYKYAVTQQSLHDGYFFVDRRVFGQLVPRQMMIYLFMCKSYSPQLGRCWNSYNDIAEQTGMKRETVIQTVNELVKGHFITRFRRRSKDNCKVFVDNLYQIVRYVIGKITKKTARLYRKYNRATGLLLSKAVGYAILNQHEMKVEVYDSDFPMTGVFSDEVYANSSFQTLSIHTDAPLPALHEDAPAQTGTAEPASTLQFGLLGNGITVYDTARESNSLLSGYKNSDTV